MDQLVTRKSGGAVSLPACQERRSLTYLIFNAFGEQHLAHAGSCREVTMALGRRSVEDKKEDEPTLPHQRVGLFLRRLPRACRVESGAVLLFSSPSYPLVLCCRYKSLPSSLLSSANASPAGLSCSPSLITQHEPQEEGGQQRPQTPCPGQTLTLISAHFHPGSRPSCSHAPSSLSTSEGDYASPECSPTVEAHSTRC